jgi:hypothetical protein
MVQRRTFIAEFKTKVVLKLITGKKSLTEASREYEIKDTVLSRWKLHTCPPALLRFGDYSGGRCQGKKTLRKNTEISHVISDI